MSRAKLVYWLFLGAVTGAVLLALVATVLGYLLAALWEGVYRLYRRWLPRPVRARSP